MRKAFVLIHRWIGLAILLFIAVAAITGTILAFDKELDRWLNDDWYYVEPQGRRMTVDELIPIAEQYYPGRTVTNARIEDDPTRSAEFSLLMQGGVSNESAGVFATVTKYQNIFINPYTGVVLGGRAKGDAGLDRRHLIPFLTKLHYTWYAGSFGKWVIGIAALIWLLDHFWAVYLSFPNATSWKKSFQFRWGQGGHKLNFDMHRSGSMWTLPILLVLALTSVYLNLGPQFKWIVNKFSPLTVVECTCHVDLSKKWSGTTVSWENAINLAREVKPDLTVGSMMFLPDTRKFVVSMKGPDDLTSESGMTKVYINATNGALMHVHDRSMETAGDTFVKWMLPLHNGRIFGLFGQIIILLSGIVITIICVTGYLIYAKKAKARDAKQSIPSRNVDGDGPIAYSPQSSNQSNS
ncbi:MAG: PepSY-associated TM helix domain-containing protein [Sideroxyarcus sp.]|nr:PepSY-associated TM helix domain-containing protein [Sideroxyarcus sp.]